MDDLCYWDGKYIHYGIAAGQSSSYCQVACGEILSTWAGPNKRSKDSMEDRVGYSWDVEPVDCPKCITWMEANLKRCDKGCGRLVTYTTCNKCLEFCICGALLDDDLKYHINCSGPKKRVS
jgi:hypothetical protein